METAREIAHAPNGASYVCPRSPSFPPPTTPGPLLHPRCTVPSLPSRSASPLNGDNPALALISLCRFSSSLSLGCTLSLPVAGSRVTGCGFIFFLRFPLFLAFAATPKRISPFMNHWTFRLLLFALWKNCAVGRRRNLWIRGALGLGIQVADA